MKNKKINFERMRLGMNIFCAMIFSLYIGFDYNKNGSLSVRSIILLIILFYNVLRYKILEGCISIIKRKIKQIIIPIFYFVVVVLAIYIPYKVHYVFFSENMIDEELFFSLWGDFITFAGALGLGFFLYYKDLKMKEKERNNKARLLYETMRNIEIVFLNIDSLLDRKEKLKTINSWELLYYEISDLVEYDEHDLSIVIGIFFKTVERINNCIERNEMECAKIILNNFLEKENYSTLQYNYIEAIGVILSISLGTKQTKPWKYRQKLEISFYADRYFNAVNAWIYNYMLSSGLDRCDISIIEEMLVDKLRKLPDISKWIVVQSDIRKIVEMIHMISLEMNKKSKVLNYYWHEYSINR